MATFKVNDRVRIVRADFFHHLVGSAATIIAPLEGFSDAWYLNVDGHGEKSNNMRHAFQGYKLAPLEDPKADAFLESIRKLRPYEEPVVEKVKA